MINDKFNQQFKDNSFAYEFKHKFNLDEAIELLSLKTQTKLDEADTRLKATFKSLCFYCIKNTKKLNQGNENGVIKFHSIKINQENSSKELIEHIVCSSCVDQNSSLFLDEKQVQGKKTRTPLKSKDVKFLCKICEEEHSVTFVPPKITINNRDTKACCAGCTIF